MAGKTYLGRKGADTNRIATYDELGGGSGLPIATAAGTADAITADYSPDVTLTNLVLVAFVATAQNTTAAPTFAPDGLTAHEITKRGGQSLDIGDIAGAGYVCIVEYNSANTRWELLNPANIANNPLMVQIFS